MDQNDARRLGSQFEMNDPFTAKNQEFISSRIRREAGQISQEKFEELYEAFLQGLEDD